MYCFFLHLSARVKYFFFLNERYVCVYTHADTYVDLKAIFFGPKLKKSCVFI